GRLASGNASSELWWLDLSLTPPVWRDLTNATSGPSPGARYGHSASYSDVTNDDDLPNQQQLPFRLSQHTGTLERVEPNVEQSAYARVPELYDPGWSTGTDGWTALSAPQLGVYYPVQFVVPGSSTDGSRVLRVEDYQANARYLDTPVSGSG